MAALLEQRRPNDGIVATSGVCLSQRPALRSSPIPEFEVATDRSPITIRDGSLVLDAGTS